MVISAVRAAQRSKLRAKKPTLPDALRPWRCVTLNVDPAEHCGVAIYDCGSYIASGCEDGFDVVFIERWIVDALAHARSAQLPLVLVLERPPRGGQAFAGRNPAGPASVIGCRKLWLRTWKHSDAIARLHCDVYPVTWRSRVLGITSGPMLARAELMRASHAAARVIGSRDEAAATLIGEWSARAGVVGALVARSSERNQGHHGG